MKPNDDMTADELRAEMEAAVGTDILSECYTGREIKVHLHGMVQRVRDRQVRRAAGLPVCVLLPQETCYSCRGAVNRRHPAEGLALYGEFVLAHRGDCADSARRKAVS